MDGIVEFWLFPRNANFPGGDLLQRELRRGRDIQSKLLDEDIIGSLADLPSAVEQPSGVSSELHSGRWRGVSPDQSPKNSDRQEESHGTSDPC